MQISKPCGLQILRGEIALSHLGVSRNTGKDQGDAFTDALLSSCHNAHGANRNCSLSAKPTSQQSPVVEKRVWRKSEKVPLLRSSTFLEDFCIPPCSLPSLPQSLCLWERCNSSAVKSDSGSWPYSLVTHFSSHSGPFQWWLTRPVHLAMKGDKTHS